MERIDGTPLDALWPNLDLESKEAISTKLSQSMKEIRALPSPGYFGSIGKRPVLDNLFWTGSGTNSLCLDGPFDTEQDLNNALVAICLSHEYPPPKKAEFYRTVFNTVLKDHPPVFTHGDLQRKNIKVRNQSRDKGQPDAMDWEVIIIDWESAGWFPSYWEYARTVFAGREFKDDWADWVAKFLKPYYNEWAWMYMLICDIWC